MTMTNNHIQGPFNPLGDKDTGVRLDYTSLQNVLNRAYEQASSGKGAERHGQDLPFEDQPMQTISNLLNTQNGMLYQAIKKIQESTRMDTDAAVRELLGAINYIAGAVIWLEKDRA
jgi:hypothetical protein